MLNRFGRRLLGMHPKPPPKYRILVMMATNMPRRSTRPCCGRAASTACTRSATRPRRAGCAPTRATWPRSATSSPRAGRQARHHHPVRRRRQHQGSRERGPHQRHPTARAHRLERRHPRQAPQGAGPARGRLRRVHRRERHAIAVHEACRAVAAYRTRKHLTIDLATIEKGGTYLGMVASVKPRTSSRCGSTRPTSSCRSPRSPASGCSSGRQLVGRVGRPRVGHHRGHAHGGLLGHGPYGRVRRDPPGGHRRRGSTGR